MQIQPLSDTQSEWMGTVQWMSRTHKAQFWLSYKLEKSYLSTWLTFLNPCYNNCVHFTCTWSNWYDKCINSVNWWEYGENKKLGWVLDCLMLINWLVGWWIYCCCTTLWWIQEVLKQHLIIQYDHVPTQIMTPPPILGPHNVWDMWKWK